MTPLEVYLSLALVLAILLLAFAVQKALKERGRRLKRQSDAFRLGGSQKLGDLSQVLGTFSVLSDYDEILLLSSTSAQSSLDLIGLRDDRLDFIEFKKSGAPLSKGQRRLRDLVAEGRLRVSYRVLDVTLPDGASVDRRP